jgi:hypothetical protein
LADVDRLRQSIDAIRDPVTGAIRCRDATARAAGCVPLDIVGSGPVDPAAVAWSAIAPRSGETLTQVILGGQMTGRSWTPPAGPVEVTIGWRHAGRSATAVPARSSSAAVPICRRCPPTPGAMASRKRWVRSAHRC